MVSAGSTPRDRSIETRRTASPALPAQDQPARCRADQEQVEAAGQQTGGHLTSERGVGPPQAEDHGRDDEAPSAVAAQQPARERHEHVEVDLGRERPDGHVQLGGEVRIQVVLHRDEAEQVLEPVDRAQQAGHRQRHEDREHHEVGREDPPRPPGGEGTSGHQRRAGGTTTRAPGPDHEEPRQHEEDVDAQAPGAGPPPRWADVAPVAAAAARARAGACGSRPPPRPRCLARPPEPASGCRLAPVLDVRTQRGPNARGRVGGVGHHSRIAEIATQPQHRRRYLHQGGPIAYAPKRPMDARTDLVTPRCCGAARP